MYCVKMKEATRNSLQGPIEIKLNTTQQTNIPGHTVRCKLVYKALT
jgi:hypothetical protein